MACQVFDLYPLRQVFGTGTLSPRRAADILASRSRKEIVSSWPMQELIDYQSTCLFGLLNRGIGFSFHVVCLATNLGWARCAKVRFRFRATITNNWPYFVKEVTQERTIGQTLSRRQG